MHRRYQAAVLAEEDRLNTLATEVLGGDEAVRGAQLHHQKHMKQHAW